MKELNRTLDPEILKFAEEDFETNRFMTEISDKTLIEGKGSAGLKNLPLETYSKNAKDKIAVVRYPSSEKPVIFTFSTLTRATGYNVPISPFINDHLEYSTHSNSLWENLIKRVAENLDLPEGYEIWNLYFGVIAERKGYRKFRYTEPKDARVVLYELRSSYCVPKVLVPTKNKDLFAFGSYNENHYSSGYYIVLPLALAPKFEPDEENGTINVSTQPGPDYAKLYKDFCVAYYYNARLAKKEKKEKETFENSPEALAKRKKDQEELEKREREQKKFSREFEKKAIELQVEATKWLETQKGTKELLEEFGFKTLLVLPDSERKVLAVSFPEMKDVSGGTLNLIFFPDDFLEDFKHELKTFIVPRYRNLRAVREFFENFGKT